MPYNEQLAERIRSILAEQPNCNERKMFGGLAFMVNGHMTCGVVEDRIMLRVGKDRYEEFLQLPHASEMDFTGKALRGMIYVDAAGIATRSRLAEWIDRALDFVLLLPPK